MLQTRVRKILKNNRIVYTNHIFLMNNNLEASSGLRQADFE